jgi:hypothetical protein
MFGIEAIYEDVVHDGAVRVGHGRVLRLSVDQGRGVVRRNVLDQVQGFRTSDFKLPHVAHVKTTGCVSNSRVFLGYSAVFDWHFEACEWN